MLLIATAIPAVISVKNSAINATAPGHPLVSLARLGNSAPGVESLQNSAIDTRVPGYPLTSMVGNWDWTQTQKITYTGARFDVFGCDVAIDGNTALVGAPGYDHWNGSVYVYTRTGATWTQQQKLIPSDSGVYDCFGVRVALDGNTAIIGADDEASGDNSGAAYVFTCTGTTWTEQQKLTPSDGAALDYFCNVALVGDTAIIGAPGDDNVNGNDSGSVYVFTRTGTTWTEQAKLLASDGKPGDFFGWEVSLSGDTALIGRLADGLSTSDSGAAYVFTGAGTTWTQQAKLLGSDSLPGDSFGYDVSLNGDTALVGAANDDDNGDYSGTAFVFTRTGTTWTEQAKLLASDGTKWDWFGCSVSLDGDTAFIGAADQEGTGGEGMGTAYVFTRTGTTWTERQHLLSSDGYSMDNFGWPVCLDGDTAFIAAWYDPTHGINSGSVYVFTKTNLTFSITGGLGVNLKITNNGIANVTGVPWWIHVQGGILGLINKTMNGTINITAGETIPVATLKLFGLGHITITAKVADEEQTATGTQIIIFSMVKK
jgi:hypothetical protein